MIFDLITHLERQRAFSERTFGPGPRTQGVIDHIKKELKEIEAEPFDLTEWIDVVLLALDGAWRAGHSPVRIAQALSEKQFKNETRTWPDWRTQDSNKAIGHVKSDTVSHTCDKSDPHMYANGPCLACAIEVAERISAQVDDAPQHPPSDMPQMAEQRTLASYRPQHDDDCSSRECDVCGHLGEPLIGGWCPSDKGHQWAKNPCTCGLAALLAPGSAQQEETTNDHE